MLNLRAVILIDSESTEDEYCYNILDGNMEDNASFLHISRSSKSRLDLG